MNQYALYAIYDTLHVPFWQKTYFYYYGFLLVTFLLVLLLGLFYFKKRVAVVSPWKKALHQLSQCQNKLVESDLENKDRYYVLSSIIKTYFYGRYGIDILSATDQECIGILYHHKVVSGELFERLHKFFLDSSMIKFAYVPINNEQVMADIATLIEVVSATIPTAQELNRKKCVNE